MSQSSITHSNTASQAGNSDMKRLTILAAAAIMVGSVAPAAAADLPARAPATYSKAPAIVEAAYDWSGFYAGINGGGATSSIDWNADGFGDEGSHNATGGTVGGQIGYRWQMSSVVFGVEAQGNWADFTGSNPSLQFAGQTNQTKIDAFGLFTGQIGYAWDRALFYVKGGAAVIDNKYTATSTLSPLVGIDTASETRWGAAVGVGFEYAFAPSWSLGFEYDHLFMGNNEVNSATGFLIADHTKEDVDLFTARVNYKFGGPLVARY
jgi:outer membrane immunogenic protein